MKNNNAEPRQTRPDISSHLPAGGRGGRVLSRPAAGCKRPARPTSSGARGGGPAGVRGGGVGMVQVEMDAGWTTPSSPKLNPKFHHPIPALSTQARPPPGLDQGRAGSCSHKSCSPKALPSQSNRPPRPIVQIRRVKLSCRAAERLDCNPRKPSPWRPARGEFLALSPNALC